MTRGVRGEVGPSSALTSTSNVCTLWLQADFYAFYLSARATAEAYKVSNIPPPSAGNVTTVLCATTAAVWVWLRSFRLPHRQPTVMCRQASLSLSPLALSRACC